MAFKLRYKRRSRACYLRLLESRALCISIEDFQVFSTRQLEFKFKASKVLGDQIEVATS